MHILIDLLDEETMDAFVCEQETFNISCPANKKIEIIPGRTVSTFFYNITTDFSKFSVTYK